MMSCSGLAGSPCFGRTRWTTPLTSSCPVPRCWTLAACESWVHGQVRRVRRGDCTAGSLFTGSKMCISVMGHSNGNGWSSLVSLVKCACVASPMWKANLDSLGDWSAQWCKEYLKATSAKGLLTVGTSAWKEFGWRVWKRGSQPEWCLRHCLPGWHQASYWYLTQLDLLQIEWKVLCHFTLVTVPCWQ